MQVSVITKERQRLSAFYNTSVVTAVVMQLINDNTKARRACTKAGAPNESIIGAQATQIYFVCEALGYQRNKVKEILDAMVVKSRFLVRDLCTLYVPNAKGTKTRMNEYVYNIAESIDEQISALSARAAEELA